MAARTRKAKIDDLTRQRIQTSQLLNRLSNHVLGKLDLSATQVRAAEVLLRKTLPDLASVDHTGETGLNVIVEIARMTSVKSSAPLIDHEREDEAIPLIPLRSVSNGH